MISQTNVLLSGSYARGTQTPNSDMVFIVISENVTFFHTESIVIEFKPCTILKLANIFQTRHENQYERIRKQLV